MSRLDEQPVGGLISSGCTSEVESNGPDCHQKHVNVAGESSGSNIGECASPLHNEAKRTGIVFISRVPPTMQPHEVRTLLAPFGTIGRVYLAPDARATRGAAAPPPLAGDGRHGRVRYAEGWVEFARRTAAKKAVAALNGMPVAASKKSRLYGEQWSLRLLPADYTWSQLSAQHVYDSAVRAQRLRAAISQGRRATVQYTAQSERSSRASSAASLATTQEQMALLAKRFKQRKPIVKE